VVLALAPATAAAAPTLTVVPSPSPVFVNTLTAVDAHGGRNVWAVGYQSLSNGSTGTLTERWDGATWSVIPSANRFTRSNRLLGVANVPGSHNTWAVGDGMLVGGPLTAHIDEWQGSFWHGVASPTVPGTQSGLFGVSALSRTDAWAVGDYVDGSIKSLIEHWDGASWSIVPSPNPSSQTNSLNSISSIAANDVWAVGLFRNDQSGNIEPLAEHWDGSAWTVVDTPALNSPAGEFFSVAKAGTHVWAVGDKFSTTTTSKRTLIERFSAGKWKVVKSPNASSADNRLNGFAVVPGGAWAVGYYYATKRSPNRQTLALSWDGTSWTLVPTPTVGTASEFFGASALQGDLWAVGDYNDGTFKTLVELGQG
jgi:hypothetical protein